MEKYHLETSDSGTNNAVGLLSPKISLSEPGDGEHCHTVAAWRQNLTDSSTKQVHFVTDALGNVVYTSATVFYIFNDALVRRMIKKHT